jgi:N-acetylglucosamine-6-phosphate deacetylase
MIVLAGGDVVLPDRILPQASLVIDGPRIAAIDPRARVDPAGATVLDLRDCFVVPGFVDGHIHGVEGFDTLDPGHPVAGIASRLPRYGVTAFCPTTVACTPTQLTGVLAQVAAARSAPPEAGARVLPAHLESNFINPEYRGAQPAPCLRTPTPTGESGRRAGERFSASDILEVIRRSRTEIGVVTLAPELPGGLELLADLVKAGHRVSLGHSGASLDEAVAAIDAGATRVTHLFNRMAPFTHRAPGLAGAALSRDELAVELICDGCHVHPVAAATVLRAKGPGRTMAITDATAAAGLAVGTEARLGGQRLRATDQVAVLDDGTWAGSTVTMDRAFATIVTSFGGTLVEAARLCATTPARELGLSDHGALVEGAVADVAVLDRRYRVVRTFIDGRSVYFNAAA